MREVLKTGTTNKYCMNHRVKNYVERGDGGMARKIQPAEAGTVPVAVSRTRAPYMTHRCLSAEAAVW